MIKLQTSSGFRAIQKIIAILNLCMGLSCKAPSYGTILIWVKKLGYNKLEMPVEIADDWIIILDESVQFGNEKLLVIYGVRQSKIDFTKALGYQDLSPLSIISGSKWTGELIQKEIEKVEGRVGKIAYAVADGGNAISKSLRDSGIPHIYDITHKFAWFCKELYKNEEEFIGYTQAMASMRGKFALSKVSHLLPPNQRWHSRFMNIEIISDWGLKALNYLDSDKINEIEHDKLEWVKKFKNIVKELSQVSSALNSIMTVIKTQGLSKKSIKKSIREFKSISIDNKRTKKLKEFIKGYLKENLNIVKEFDKVLCTSDIIESSFGKYKNYISNNPMTGITNLSLCMSAFTCELSEENLLQAMESTRNIDIRNWSKENIGETNLTKRKSFLKKQNEE